MDLDSQGESSVDSPYDSRYNEAITKGVFMMLDKKQLTVRLPQATVDYLSQKALDENKSLNDIMTHITDEYMKWHDGDNSLKEIALLREKVKSEYGVHPDSTGDIRKLRDGDR
jgi:hypothetical protein